MNFLGCDGIWLLQESGNTVCQGELKTYTVQDEGPAHALADYRTKGTDDRRDNRPLCSSLGR